MPPSSWLRLPLAVLGNPAPTGRVAALAMLAVCSAVAGPGTAPYGGLLFEGHIHYNENSWDVVTPGDAIERMRAAGIRHAFVSSTPTAGTERLFAIDPALVVPLLRPYRSPADRRDWFADPTLLPRLEHGLAAFPYRGIGEFHIFGADASTPVMADMIDLAAERGLFLHAHADEEAIVRIAQRAPGLTVIWAHAGFDVPVARLAELLAAHPRLMIELSYRGDIAPLGQLAGGWHELFVKWPDRFILGADTHVAGRWSELGELVDEMRLWLAQLPPEVADRIAFRNAAELAGAGSTTQR
jgi:hypothetical protein